MKDDLIYFITGNSHKFEEINNAFIKGGLNYKLEQKDLAPLEIQAESLEDVAIFKLKEIKEELNTSCFVEDAGFFIDNPLNGFPGVYSSYVFKTLGNEALLRMIDDFEGSKAHFKAVIAFYLKQEEKILTFDGSVYGRVAPEMRGNQGFGFDPIFIPEEVPDKTFAELSTEEKNKVSHRGRALNKLIKFLQEGI